MQHAIFSKLVRLSFIVALIAGLVWHVSSTDHAKAESDSFVYLPLILRPEGPSSPEQAAINHINLYRTLAGAAPVQLHTALVTSARNHANYDILNYGDPSAWVNGPHGEVVGKPGFTGENSADRMLAAQFPYAPSAEVMDYFDDPVRSVDTLMATVFHRAIVLNPAQQYGGYGHGRSQAEVVDVIDFGRGPTASTGQPGVVVYPSAGQTNVPLYGTSETPSPLPSGATYPIGYPITIQPIFGSTLTVDLAELRDGSGVLVNVHPNPSGCGTVCYALIPVVPLQPATTYTVHIVGSVDGVAFNRTWAFTTTACVRTGFC